MSGREFGRDGAGRAPPDVQMASYKGQDPVLQYTAKNTLRLHPVQEKLIQVTRNHEWGVMLGAADEIQLLCNLCKLIKAKKTLDIGVYTGYSAMSIAMVLPPDGVVVACDTSEEYANIGRPFWREAGVEHKIDLRIGPAMETLQRLVDEGESGNYDFAFIDADKANYDGYYELCLQLVRSGGIITFDNTLLGLKVLDIADQSERVNLQRALTEKLHKDERVDISMLYLGDGTTLAFKR